MRRAAAILALVVLSGCAGPERAFVSAVDQSFTLISREYLVYLEHDAMLSDSDKATRRRTVELLRALIEEAKTP